MKQKDFSLSKWRIMVMPCQYSAGVYKVCVADFNGEVEHNTIASDVDADDLGDVVAQVIRDFNV